MVAQELHPQVEDTEARGPKKYLNGIALWKYIRLWNAALTSASYRRPRPQFLIFKIKWHEDLIPELYGFNVLCKTYFPVS